MCLVPLSVAALCCTMVLTLCTEHARLHKLHIDVRAVLDVELGSYATLLFAPWGILPRGVDCRALTLTASFWAVVITRASDLLSSVSRSARSKSDSEWLRR
jgi:hypothetical protein